jgi:glyoxylase-like metal-dependent hydrolase (beta-lactamase superfamily II)
MHKAAHTPLPLIVYVPIDNLVYAGDILYRGRLLSLVTGSSVRQWIETYRYMKKFNDAKFIPGHGQPGALTDFDGPTLSYLQMLDKYMRQALIDGVDMQDAVRGLDQSAYAYLENFTMLAGRNANLAYQEAERAAFE